MSDVVLRVENLYKRYRLGTVDRQTFKEDMISWWAKVRGKPDPYEQYITSNELANIKDSEAMRNLQARYVWALQDINFEVKQGEIVGIIGKNGAGKSTLLKILSKTTTPTKGKVKVKGRIASLLEVGTGFHGELTGRENIYLNGAILGMTRHEIRARLDEIIDFAGVEAYIDTPVKRYSSGMYVRLAFAVGAHLLSDILIVDEVLAVGDAEFQKKCIGKMQDVSKGEGRTVLFVSHNMVSVKSLCSRGILLKNGSLIIDSYPDKAINAHLQNGSENCLQNSHSSMIEVEGIIIYFLGIKKKNGAFQDTISVDDEMEMIIDYELQEGFKYHFTFHLINELGDTLFSFSHARAEVDLKTGKNKVIFNLPQYFFNEGSFSMNLLIVKDSKNVVYKHENVLSFNIVPDKIRMGEWMGKEPGFLKPKFNCRIETSKA